MDYVRTVYVGPLRSSGQLLANCWDWKEGGTLSTSSSEPMLDMQPSRLVHFLCTPLVHT